MKLSERQVMVIMLAVLLPLLAIRICQQPGRYASRQDGGNGEHVSTPVQSPSPAATATTVRPATPTTLPSATPNATATPTSVPLLSEGEINGWVTHYGTSFQGRPMGCGGTYESNDPTIAAVAFPSRNTEWPCGTVLEVEGPAGTIRVVRRDSCPGCGHNHIDLSEAGITSVCGGLGACSVRIRVLR